MNKVSEYIEQIEEKTGSSTFCVLPWIHVATRPNGDMRLCCSSNASGAKTGDLKVGLIKTDDGVIANFGKDGIKHSFNNEFMRNVRKDMLSNKVPPSCTKCFEEESNGVLSKRIWEYVEWSNELDIDQLIADTEQDGSIPPVIRYFDLRLGHTCNLKCVMCTPHDSSSWVKENAQIVKKIKNNIVIEQIKWEKFDNFWFEKDQFWGEIFEQIPNISHIYFAGGEPLMIKEHKLFLEQIIKMNMSSKIQLRYNTNILFVNQEIIDIWSNFKRVRVACSIDAMQHRNYYIRYPSKWSEIEEKLLILDNSPNNIYCTIACTVQALNIKHIPDFVKWKLSQNYKKINSYEVNGTLIGGGLINLHLLYIPSFLSARVLPKEDKLEIRKIYEEFKDWLYVHYTQDQNFWEVNPQGWKRWEAILQFIESDDHTHLLAAFKEYIKNINESRNLNFKEIFPELAHLM